jgi:ParB-like chromosome segregation protein Spo0J
MQLEFHQLDRRWEHLRVRHPARQRRLLASLADSGQQTPIVVVAAEGQAGRYVVIDSYKRIAALEQLGRDTVEAVVWPMGEAAAEQPNELKTRFCLISCGLQANRLYHAPR